MLMGVSAECADTPTQSNLVHMKQNKEGMDHSLLETTDQISEPPPPKKKKNQAGYWMFGFQFSNRGADVTVVIYSCF